MRRMFNRSWIVAASLLFGCSLPLSAAVIYDNSVNDLTTRFEPGTLEVGDEIILSGPERYLTNFSFEFWGTNTASPGNITFAGNVEARVRFYLNDGPPFNGYPTPEAKFYDSDWFPVAPTPRSVEIFTLGNDFPWAGLFLPVASNMTWSVQFRGMAPSDSVGVDIYSPAYIGQSYPDYWENNFGTWVLRTNNLAPVDFAARMEASAQPYVNTEPPILTNVVSGASQTLSWAGDHTGWKLQTQTNGLAIGLGTNWHTLSVTRSTNVWTFPIDPANESVFYRLIYP